MFQSERSDVSKIIERRKGVVAGRWAMLGLLGAGAAAVALQQTRRRVPRKTPLDYALEGADRTTDAPETAPHSVEVPGGAGRTQPEPAAESQAGKEAGSKMNDAAPFREREFSEDSRAKTPNAAQDETRIVDQHQMEPDAIAAGGDIGELEGDKQSFGEVPTIIDQTESAPVFSQQN